MTKINSFRLLLFVSLVNFTCFVSASELISSLTAAKQIDHGQEEFLIETVESIRVGNIDHALETIKRVVDINPKFRLAQLIYADLLLSKSRPIRDFGNYFSASYSDIDAMREEIRARVRHYLSPPPVGRIPAPLVMLGEGQQNVVVVDMNASRLYLFQNRDGIPVLTHDFYATIGKNGTGKFIEGDQKTPVGVYFVTGFINPENLPDLYGDGAYPIDYPNVWDRRHGRTGYGIWLHGTPSFTYSRPPRDSDGCVIVSNQDLQSMSPILKSGEVPVVLAENIEWLDEENWRQRQGRYTTLVEQWRKDWESRDAGLYLSHYSPSYSGLGMDYDSWVDHKTRVNPSKRYIKIGISDKSIFMYPGEDGLLVITFKQEYDSDNFQRNFFKRQLWRMEEDGKWRIIYEGSMS